MYFCRIGKAYPKKSTHAECIRFTNFDSQDADPAREASCLECLSYSIVVSREKLKSGAGPAAERDLRGPIKSLNCPSSRGLRQTNHGITTPVPRY